MKLGLVRGGDLGLRCGKEGINNGLLHLTLCERCSWNIYVQLEIGQEFRIEVEVGCGD